MNIIILCLKIFFARILDVSIGVVRTMEIVNNHIFKAVVLAFFEVLIWFLVAKEALTSTNEFNLLIAICYSLGYSFGTLIGAYLSNKLINNVVRVDVIFNEINEEDINQIKRCNYGLSSLTLDNKKRLLFIETSRRNLNDLLKIIENIDKNAFISVSDIKKIKKFNFMY